MDSDLHRTQATVYLIEPLKRWLASRGESAYVSGNSFVYYDRKESPIGPDVYVVLGGVPRNQPSWVVWDEGDRYPDVIVELLSPSTEDNDRGRKFVLYRDRFRTRDYFLYSVEKQRLEGFRLDGDDYLSIQAGPGARIPCSSMPLSLGVHDGWLRWFDAEGALLRTGDELAEEERQRADELQRRLEAAEAALRRLQDPG